MTDNEEPYPSLSDYHDYEPNLEFDDTELQSPTADIGKLITRNIVGFQLPCFIQTVVIKNIQLYYLFFPLSP